MFDYAITLLTDKGAEIRIETDFSLRNPGGPIAVTISPEMRDQAAVILPAVLHETIRAAAASNETGTLVLDFVHGVRLEVAANPDYEAWTVAAENGSKVVALPGGGLSTWDGNT